MTKSIIIFGGSGFIGQEVCQQALDANLNVISVSKHGLPHKEQPWMYQSNMTWIACDILTDDSWQYSLPKADYCLNLIGNFFETKQQTYQDMIVKTNDMISQWAKRQNIPYLFLSAKLGPKGYVLAKRKAEQEALKRDEKILIIRSGLVTDTHKPLKQLQGELIRLGYKCPLAKPLLRKVFPVKKTTLASVIIKAFETEDFKNKLIDLTK